MNSPQANALRYQEHDPYALRLPTELLIAIVDQVEADEDLLTLAITSRQLHALSLHRYFTNYDFDPNSTEIEIHSFNESRYVLRALALSLDVVGRSIERLSYDCGYSQDPEQMTREVQLLTEYISKLASVRRASLRIALNSNGNVKKRRDAYIVLLNTILEKRCSDIRVLASQFAPTTYESKDMPRHTKPREWVKDYWPVHHNPPRTQHLTSCLIQSFPRFLRPFYSHTLSINSTCITELTFKNVFGGGADWSTMLAHLRFPRLHRLTVTYGVIPRDPFIKFLTKHPNILSYFEYHHIRYEPHPKNPVRRVALETIFKDSLETLTTSSEHINNFFPSFAVFSHLTDITINIEEHISIFSSLEGALTQLAACVNKITLTLAISGTGLGFSSWFMKVFAPETWTSASARPETKLHCVETLIMDNGNWGFAGALILTHLPRWIVLFPELRALTLRSSQRSYIPVQNFSNDDNDGSEGGRRPGDITAVLKDTCPGLYVECITREFSSRVFTFDQ
ncbi:hypothetical protein BDN70DRAFT_880367 [Pholiota conissans]|uniref:F-box domain-containing protein n=1 Tax=Pholiota conissans TaxID=109636 RepID=A0A9P5YZU0_9AGAR|nr:hypothetical protein BDN70DRAFT_880367 [Pholiota conissans]